MSDNVATESMDELNSLNSEMGMGGGDTPPAAEAPAAETPPETPAEKPSNGSSNYDAEAMDLPAPEPPLAADDAESDPPAPNGVNGQRRGNASSQARGQSFREEMAGVRAQNEKLLEMLSQQITRQPSPAAPAVPQIDPHVAAEEEAKKHLAHMQQTNDLQSFYKAVRALQAPERAASEAKLAEATAQIDALQRGQRMPGEDALFNDFPFLSDARNADVADGYTKVLAARDHRDMSNPQVRIQTMREAASMTAKVLGIGGNKDNPNRAVAMQRMGGSAMRETAPAAAPEGVMTDAQKMLAVAWAPGLDPLAAQRAWAKKFLHRLG